MLFPGWLTFADCRDYACLVSLKIALNALLYYSSGTYDDWYYLYLLVPHSLALYLEIYILAHLLSGLLLDIVVTWDSHINYQTPFLVFLLYYDVWLIAWDVPICFDLVVPQDGCLLILHYSFWIMLVPVLCIHFDSIVLTYIQMQLGSYLVVPVKVLICC